ncbi:M20 family metallopeptidase [Brevibacillus ginsengisoli]|uniref:M20 family metallopeptidase n=1 Tax=Brevibacillus ginsengisoli TaxID=363854 RepID=UPI003CFB52C0
MSILSYIEEQKPEFLRLLEESVNIDSPSGSREQAAVMADWYTRQFERLTMGGKVERIFNTVYGDQLRCIVGNGKKRVLLLGHYDTVWPIGETDIRPFTIKDDKAFGPGSYDMKAALLQAMFAIRGLQELGRFPADKQVVLFINSDEEIGSPTSRELIEREARASDVAFVLEPPMAPNGALKTWRKGSGWFKVQVQGISAHAGVDHQNGVSAIEELAHHVQYLHSLTNYESGTTVNVGMIKGGIGANVVADYAEADVDVRVMTAAEAKRIEELILQLKPVRKGTRLTVTGGIRRPPMERSSGTAELFALARRIGEEELGLHLEESGTGGVSDGNFTAACGVPTLDGLGIVGDYAHSPDEYVNLREISRRTVLLARLIEEC